MLLVPAIQTQGSSPANVQLTPGMTVFGTPGGRNGNEGRLQVDGLGVGAARNGGGVSGYNADVANAQEITFTVSAGLGEAEVSGPALSIVPKTGGNSVKGSVYVAGVSSGMVGTNYTDELKAMGLSVPGELLKLWDFTGGVGGPIKRDRLWYFLNLRNQGSHSSVPSMFANKNAGDATKWTYEADTTRQSRTAGSWSIASLRVTAQATRAQQVQRLLGRAEAVHRRDRDDPRPRGAVSSRRKAASSTAAAPPRHPKRRPTRTAISACSSSRGSRR